MSTLTASNAKPERISFSRLVWVGPMAGVAAAIANLIVFIIAKNLVGIPFVMPLFGPGSPPESLPAFMVIVTSVVPALVAAVFLWILGKFAPGPILIFQVVSLFFLLFSFSGPFSLPVDLPTKLALSVMHVVAAVAIVGVLTTLGRKK